MNIFGFILVLIILFMVRRGIRKYLKKKDIEIKPLSYRKYNLLVYLTEVVHYETMPAFGLASSIISNNFKFVSEEMLRGNETKIISIVDLPAIYATAIPTTYPHYQLFRIFFDDLTKRKVVGKDMLENIIKAIDFGV